MVAEIEKHDSEIKARKDGFIEEEQDKIKPHIPWQCKVLDPS